MSKVLSRSVPDWLYQRAQTSPSRPAIVSAGETLSFRDLNDRADVAWARLRAAGVEPGDLVAVLAGNSVAFAQLVHGLARAGAVIVPLNIRLNEHEVAWQLEDCGARYLVADRHNVGRSEGLVKSVRVLVQEDLVASGAAGSAPQPSAPTFDLEGIHSVIYTSGTTGRPKGAMLTYGNHFWSATASAFNLGLHADDCWLACMPLFHVGGLSILLRGAIYGMAVEIHESFDERRVNEAIDSGRITIVSVVATMLQRMLDDRGERPFPNSLRCILAGGGPVPISLLERCLALAGPVVQTYGLTETASQVATLAPEDAVSHAGSAGKPLMGTEVGIDADDGRLCGPNEAGEITVRGPTVMRGYLNGEVETAASLAGDWLQTVAGGWLHTGDYGYVDSAGYLYVLDRRDDLIVSGGENVYPAEIEAVLEAHPDVLEACVYGRPDPRWGQTPVAAVVVRAGRSLNVEALKSHCRQQMAGFKVPVDFRLVAELPRTASGKLMRHKVREG